jgi:hypothetical protein
MGVGEQWRHHWFCRGPFMMHADGEFEYKAYKMFSRSTYFYPKRRFHNQLLVLAEYHESR